MCLGAQAQFGVARAKKNPHRIRQGAVGGEASRSELGQLGVSLTTHRRPRKWFLMDRGLNSVSIHTESLLMIVWTPVDMNGWQFISCSCGQDATPASVVPGRPSLGRGS